MLKVDSVHTFYGAVEALKGVSLTVNAGEITTLVGANGAGKSTLLMTMCGHPQARQGKIIFNGQDITHWPTHDIARSGIAHVPEGRRIFSRMSVRENLQMGCIRSSHTFSQDLERVFSLFPRLKERQHQRAGTLSGGEQQMLALGRALISRPRLLLLDEPSLGLAPLVVTHLFQVIKDLNQKEGLTIFLVEQNAHMALTVAHQGYVLASGQILLHGTGAQLLANPEVQAAYLEGVKPVS